MNEINIIKERSNLLHSDRLNNFTKLLFAHIKDHVIQRPALLPLLHKLPQPPLNAMIIALHIINLLLSLRNNPLQ